MKQRSFSWWLLFLLTAFMALYGLGYLVLGDRLYPPPLADSFRARPWGIYPHAFFGIFVILTGPFQFLGSVLKHRRPLHRTLGKVYVLAGLGTGLTGLYMAYYAFGGWITQLGFGGMAATATAATAMAYLRIREGDVAAHRAWVLRSYAVFFSAVTLRVWLPVLINLHAGDFTLAYQWVAWLSWVPNLLWAEWYLRRRPTRRARPAPALARAA